LFTSDRVGGAADDLSADLHARLIARGIVSTASVLSSG
jgi:hypothetical protein